MKRLILQNKVRCYELYEWSDGGLSINVLCGGHIEFEAEIKLTKDEVERFHEWGESFLDDLAYDINRNPSKYQNRRVSS